MSHWPHQLGRTCCVWGLHTLCSPRLPLPGCWFLFHSESFRFCLIVASVSQGDDDNAIIPPSLQRAKDHYGVGGMTANTGRRLLRTHSRNAWVWLKGIIYSTNVFAKVSRIYHSRVGLIKRIMRHNQRMNIGGLQFLCAAWVSCQLRWRSLVWCIQRLWHLLWFSTQELNFKCQDLLEELLTFLQLCIFGCRNDFGPKQRGHCEIFCLVFFIITQKVPGGLNQHFRSEIWSTFENPELQIQYGCE